MTTRTKCLTAILKSIEQLRENFLEPPRHAEYTCTCTHGETRYFLRELNTAACLDNAASKIVCWPLTLHTALKKRTQRSIGSSCLRARYMSMATRCHSKTRSVVGVLSILAAATVSAATLLHCHRSHENNLRQRATIDGFCLRCAAFQGAPAECPVSRALDLIHSIHKT